MCFFLSSTCTIFIWNSITIIRTARNRGLGSYLLEFPCQCFIHIPWSLAPRSSPLLQLFYSFYRFFYNTFTLPFFFLTMFHSFLVHSFSEAQVHTQVPNQLCVKRCFTGLSLTHVFIFHNITTCQERQLFACLLLILTHITPQWSKRKGHRQTMWWLV